MGNAIFLSMRGRGATRGGLPAACLVLLGAGLSWADGSFFGQVRAMTHQAVQAPGIPSQRAILAFKEGRETLIVESALEGPGERFGWVIPVPAAPDAVAAVSPGALRSMAAGIQPRLIHDDLLPFSMFLAMYGWIFLFLFAMWCGQRRAGISVLRSVFEVGGIAAVLFILFSLSISKGPAAGNGASVLQKTRAGSYEVSVVGADDAGALYAWLKREGLAVPEAARPIVDDYARRGWRFVTAKLATDGKGRAAPHPLSLSFKTERAVYPMRLTALGGADLELELYVVAGQAAGAPGLKRVFCDRFERRGPGDRPETALARWPFGNYELKGHYRGAGSHLRLGHPGFAALLWDGAWVSKLQGKLAPAEMDRDLEIGWSAPVFEQRVFHTEQGLKNLGALLGMLIGMGAVCAALVLWGYRLGSNRAALGVILGGLALGYGACQAPPRLMSHVEAGSLSRRQVEGVNDVKYLFRGAGGGAAALTPDEVRTRLRVGALSGEFRNPFTGEELREGDGPGEYSLRPERGGVEFTLYDLGGTPMTLSLVR